MKPPKLTLLLLSFSMILGSVAIPSPAAGGTTWALEVADGTAGAGRFPSIAIGVDGWPRVAYSYGTGEELRYAWRDAGGWHNQTVDRRIGPGSVGLGPSIVVTATLIPEISYITMDASAYQSVWYAYWDQVSLSWKMEFVGGAGTSFEGARTSIALNSTGSPSISYIDHDTGELLYFYKSAGVWIREVVDFPGQTIPNPESLKIDSLGTPHIAYYDGVNGTLRHAFRSASRWYVETVDSSSPNVGYQPSMALDSLGHPHIAYIAITPGMQLKYAEWTGSSWRIVLIPGASSVESPSLALNSTGVPRISYDVAGVLNLMYSYWDGASWRSQLVDNAGAEFENSMAIDTSDVVHISYFHLLSGVGGRLKYARGEFVNDPPVSSVMPIPPYWQRTSPVVITSTASDSDGVVVRVDLWYRFDGGSGWTSWAKFASDTSSPWQWFMSFPDGEGRYEFCSLAFDGQSMETKSLAAEASAGYDATAPVSSAVPTSPYWHYSPSLILDAIATDLLSGVADLTLIYSHAPLDNSTWGSWIPLGTETAEPWSWSFSFPEGEGHYRFHTIATDVAGNGEGGKTIAEAVAGYRTLPDYIPDNPLPPSNAVVGLSLPLNISLDVRNLKGGTNETATLAFYNESTPLSPFLTIQVPPVPPGATSGPFSATWMSPAAPCSSRVVADVDYGGNVEEANETNNTYVWTISVVAGPITSIVIGSPNYTSPALSTFIKSTTPLDFSTFDRSGVGIRNTTYAIDSGAPANYTATGTFFLPGEGPHLVEWRSLDWAGNFEQVSSKVLMVDNTPPITTISPATGEFNITTVFTLAATDGGSEVKTTYYRIGGGGLTPYSGGFTVPEGLHAIFYYSIDNLDNTELVRRVDVNVQAPLPPNTPPSIALNTPIGGEEWLKGSTHIIVWTMHDDQDINANLTIYINYTTGGVANQLVVLKGQLSFEWTVPDIEANDVVVNVTVIDSGGFKGWSQSGPFTIEAPPSPPQDSLSQYWWLIVVLISVVATLLILFFVIRKRRQGKETKEQEKASDSPPRSPS